MKLKDKDFSFSAIEILRYGCNCMLGAQLNDHSDMDSALSNNFCGFCVISFFLDDWLNCHCLSVLISEVRFYLGTLPQSNLKTKIINARKALGSKEKISLNLIPPISCMTSSQNASQNIERHCDHQSDMNTW